MAQFHPWAPAFPKPAHIYRTANVNALGGVQSPLLYMVTSLAGLATKSVREGTGDAMLWIDMQGANEYKAALLTDVLQTTQIHDEGVKAAWTLVDTFKASNVVKGYILYDYENSSRVLYAAGAFNESVNVATSLASILGGIIIPSSLEATAQAHGLTLLLDARDKTEQWAWDNYKSQFYTRAVLVQDPKLPCMRDYCIALGAFCMYGVDSLTSTVYAALEPNTPVLGWNQGDEFAQTSLATDWGHWNAANNLFSNLPVLSCIEPGPDFPLSETDLNAKSRLDLSTLTWEKDVHYTSLLLSDGDSFNLNIYYLNDPERMYYQHRDRGEFPFCWGTAAADLFQSAPSVLRLLTKQSTANDSHLLFAGGYYYPDRYGSKRSDAPLSAHMGQLRPLLEAMGMRMILLNFSNWSSGASATARNTIAHGLPGLDAVFGIDYNPYTAGQGQIFWHDNGIGTKIPVFMARYTIWSSSTQPGGGTPLAVADLINAAAHTGPANSNAYFDWTIVHAWSYFKNGNDTPQNVVANVTAGIERAYGSARWCAERLASHVRLVTPDRLAWYARMHLQPRQTFTQFLDFAQTDLTASDKPASAKAALQVTLDALRGQVNALDTTNESAKQATFESIQTLWQGIKAPLFTQRQISFEPGEGFSVAPLPQQGWTALEGNPGIATAPVQAGQQALLLDAESVVRGPFGFVTDGVFWADGYLRPTTMQPFDPALPAQPLGPLVMLTADRGLMALNGDGQGGGQWTDLGTPLTNDNWYRLTLRIDQPAHAWNLYLNRKRLATGLGFKDNSLVLLQGSRFSGASAVDNLTYSAQPPVDISESMTAPAWAIYQ